MSIPRPRDLGGSEAGSVKGAKHPKGLPLTGSAERLRWTKAGECGEVDMKDTQGLLVRKEGGKGPVDDLGDSQAVQVSLSPNRLNPAALDMEGDTLGLLGAVADLGESRFATLPPGYEFLKVRYQTDNHVIGGRESRYVACGVQP